MFLVPWCGKHCQFPAQKLSPTFFYLATSHYGGWKANFFFILFQTPLKFFKAKSMIRKVRQECCTHSFFFYSAWRIEVMTGAVATIAWTWRNMRVTTDILALTEMRPALTFVHTQVICVLKHRSLDPSPRDSGSVGLKWDTRICVSNSLR